MISRIIGVGLLPWGGYAASTEHPGWALLLIVAGIVCVFWHTPKREPTVSSYLERVRDLDEQGWEIIDAARSVRGRLPMIEPTEDDLSPVGHGIRPDAVD